MQHPVSHKANKPLAPPLTKKGTATPRCAPTCGTAAQHQPPLHSNVYVYKISV